MESFDVLSWSKSMATQLSQWETWFNQHQEQVHKKSGEAWSPAEVLEHIALVEMGVSYRLKTAVVPIDASEKLGAGKLAHVLVTRRDVKVNAPDNTKPKNTWATWEETLQVFAKSRRQLLEDVENGTIKPVSMGMVHPRLGEMSVTDWLYFLHSHAERHWHQLQETLAH